MLQQPVIMKVKECIKLENQEIVKNELVIWTYHDFLKMKCISVMLQLAMMLFKLKKWFIAFLVNIVLSLIANFLNWVSLK